MLPADSSAQDIWAQWLLQRRHAGDAAYIERIQSEMRRVRDRVLDGAKLAEGMTLADIGAGEGLIGFGAIERIGPSLRIVFTDVSRPLLQHVWRLADERGVGEQCSFVLGSAEQLDGIGDESIDVVATRASLAYVPQKQAAFQEIYRVLKPGGRISIAEPISQDMAFETCALAKMIESQPAHPETRFLRLLHRCRATQYPSTEQEIQQNPLTNFSERDLVLFVREAGFAEVHLELQIDYHRGAAIPWDVYLDISPHPWAPTLREILATRFSCEERRVFETAMRPTVESDQNVTSEVVAYLTADKPHDRAT